MESDLVDNMDNIYLSYKEQERRTALILRLTNGTISLTEARNLRALLERERHMITQQGNCLALFAVRFLIGCVDEYLESNSNSLLASKMEKR
jgi:hypothetical protein